MSGLSARRMTSNSLAPSSVSNGVGIHADSRLEELREGRDIIRDEALGLMTIADRLDQGFSQAIEMIHGCSGNLVITGMGKAGLIGQKIGATFSSTGTRARFLHPADAVHGDLGCVSPGDVLLVLSNSGETEEVCRLLPSFQRIPVPVIAITAQESSTLGKNANAVIRLGTLREAGHIGLAPSTTTTAMLAIGDALSLVVSRKKQFTPQHFSLNHPGGSLGRRLTTAAEIMRQGNELRIASAENSVRQVLSQQERTGRRTGAVILVDSTGRLSGLFTDSDLVRLLERREDSKLDAPIRDVMTLNPLTIHATTTLEEAVRILSERKISELPVIDSEGKPIGIVDITDVIGRMPEIATDPQWACNADPQAAEDSTFEMTRPGR